MARNNSATKEILSVAWNQDNTHILYSEKGERIPKVLNVKTNQFFNMSNESINYTGNIKFVLWLDSYFCTYSSDGLLHIWGFYHNDNMYKSYYSIVNKEITSFSWNSNRKLLAISYMMFVHTIEVQPEKIPVSFGADFIRLSNHITIASIAWSPGGRHIALCNKKIEKSSKDKSGYLLSIWNTENPKLVSCVAVLDSLYQKVCHENKYVSGYGGRGTGKARHRTIESCTETYYSSDFISWSPNGNYITYNNNYEKLLIIFELVKNNNKYSTKNDKAFKCNFKNITSIIFDSLSENIICSSKDGKLQICNINSSDVKLYKTINRPINQIQISSDGQYLAVASNTLDVLDYIMIQATKNNSKNNYNQLESIKKKINNRESILTFSGFFGMIFKGKDNKNVSHQKANKKNLTSKNEIESKISNKYNSFKINLPITVNSKNTTANNV